MKSLVSGAVSAECISGFSGVCSVVFRAVHTVQYAVQSEDDRQMTGGHRWQKER